MGDPETPIRSSPLVYIAGPVTDMDRVLRFESNLLDRGVACIAPRLRSGWSYPRWVSLSQIIALRCDAVARLYSCGHVAAEVVGAAAAHRIQVLEQMDEETDEHFAACVAGWAEASWKRRSSPGGPRPS